VAISKYPSLLLWLFSLWIALSPIAYFEADGHANGYHFTEGTFPLAPASIPSSSAPTLRTAGAYPGTLSRPRLLALPCIDCGFRVAALFDLLSFSVTLPHLALPRRISLIPWPHRLGKTLCCFFFFLLGGVLVQGDRRPSLRGEAPTDRTDAGPLPPLDHDSGRRCRTFSCPQALQSFLPFLRLLS